MDVISITPMEKYMLLLIRQGKKDREIATYLNCNYDTLKSRLFQLRKKTGCSSTKELLCFAYDNNIFTKQPQQ